MAVRVGRRPSRRTMAALGLGLCLGAAVGVLAGLLRAPTPVETGA